MCSKIRCDRWKRKYFRFTCQVNTALRGMHLLSFSMCPWAMAVAMLRPQPAAWRLMETAWACARLVRVARATGCALGHPGFDPDCPFVWLIIRLIQLVFSVEIVFFSHKILANSVFQPAYNSSQTAPLSELFSGTVHKNGGEKLPN
jgi:hypothetical protein